MNEFILFLLVLNTHYVTPLNKCCDVDSKLKKNNSIYICDKDEDKRLQILSEHTNHLKNVTEGICLDVNKTITEYIFKNHTIFEEAEVDVNYYPKCCPLGYFYNSITHSCKWKNITDESFITQNFIRVGLPHCWVIVDYPLVSGSYRMELGNLYIGENTKFTDGQFCIDKNEEDFLIARGCFDDLSVCYDSLRCIHKCCPDGQSFVDGKNCRNTYVHGVDLSFSDRINNSQDPFALIHRYNCRIYILKKRTQYYVDTDGNFYAFYNKTNSFLRFGIEDKTYCIEHVVKGNLNNFEFFMCFQDTEIESKFLAARWAQIMSVVFIFITICVYCFLPEMLNLFGKSLVSCCVSMFFLFVLLIYGQFDIIRSDKSCIITSFLTTYVTFSSFCWLNVMCFNIWWTFGTPKSFKTTIQNRSELKKILMYSLYGWGLPVVLTAIAYLAFAVFNTPYVIRPFLGSYKCFWERRSGNYGKFLYYVTPLILMEFANLVFFWKTIFYCLKVKGEINRMNDNRMSTKERKKSYDIDKEQLFLIVKLSVVMGISFVFEVVSSLFPFTGNPVLEYVEVVWDTINCLQGVFIFFIFVFKKKVLLLCRNRVRTEKDRKTSVSSLPTGVSQVSEPLNSKSKIRNM